MANQDSQIKKNVDNTVAPNFGTRDTKNPTHANQNQGHGQADTMKQQREGRISSDDANLTTNK